MSEDNTHSPNCQQVPGNNLTPFANVHHSFDVGVAAKYGVHEAILIHHFLYWIKYNQRLNRNSFEGRTWTYQTIKEIAAHFEYLSVKQVERLLMSLVKKDILIKGNFNKLSYDRTIWYAFKEEEKWGINREMHFPKSGNGFPESGTPVPHPKPNTKTEKKERGLSKEKSPLSQASSNEKRRYGEFQHIKLTEAEHQKLIDRLGKEDVDKKITAMDLFIGSKGKDPYASHYFAVLKWKLADNLIKMTGNPKKEKERPRAFENENLNVSDWTPKKMNEKGEWI